MERLGPYLLVRRLAVGGMAEIYLAEPSDEPGAASVVIKTILPELRDRPDIVEMFSDEIRINGLLHHDNIVALEDYGDSRGVPFIVFEYIEGITFAHLLAEGKGEQLPLPLICWIVAETCAGLGHAHRRDVTQSSQRLGIVHRDISPQNLLFSTTGQVKIADFGVAKADMRLTKTSPGQFKGKYAYTSPEQCEEEMAIDFRSDIFSIGAVLYEAVTGHLVYGSVNPMKIVDAVREERYTPPDRWVADLPDDLALIINRSLRWNPAERYQDALEMQRDLMGLVPRAYPGPAELSTRVQRYLARRSAELRALQPAPTADADSVATTRVAPRRPPKD